MDLNDLNVYKQTQNNFTEFRPTNNLQPIAPPLPPRPNNRNAYGYTTPMDPLFSSYGSNNYFSNYGYSPYSNPFSSYGNFNSNQPSNSFLRAAEENSRNAFQSIQSVVQAFTSVSAMFESTFHAVYNSFRAVVGVADQFYRLKTNLSNMISAFAIFRALKYLYYKLLIILRLKKLNKSNEVWKNVSNLTDAELVVKDALKKPNTNWPLLLFFGVVVGGPWLIWKILSSIESNNKDDKLWMSGKIDHFVAVAEHDFDAENNDEISFRRSQRIIIAPKEYQPKMRGWLLGTVDGKSCGIIPANYVKIMGKKVVQESPSQTQTLSKLSPKTESKPETPESNTISINSMEQLFDSS